MKRLALFSLILLLIAGIAYAKEYKLKKKAGNYEVEVKIDKNPPTVGNNNVEIEIKDNSGRYITDAKVIVEYSMPPMPGMPPMDYKVEAKQKDKGYVATMNLSMSGPWNITIKIKRDDKTSTMKFNIDVS